MTSGTKSRVEGMNKKELLQYLGFVEAEIAGLGKGHSWFSKEALTLIVADYREQADLCRWLLELKKDEV